MWELLSTFSKLNEDEQEAIAGYCDALDVIEKYKDNLGKNYNQVVSMMKDYISEEMKHAKGLSDVFSKISEIVPER
jgi:uncharacterized protein (UPF0264 family)